MAYFLELKTARNKMWTLKARDSNKIIIKQEKEEIVQKTCNIKCSREIEQRLEQGYFFMFILQTGKEKELRDNQ